MPYVQNACLYAANVGAVQIANRLGAALEIQGGTTADEQRVGIHCRGDGAKAARCRELVVERVVSLRRALKELEGAEFN